MILRSIIHHKMKKYFKKELTSFYEKGLAPYYRPSGVQGWKPSARGKNSMGFTMIELILFMGLMSILLVVLMHIFATVLSIQLESERTSNTVQDARFLMSRLSYDINRAKSIDLPDSLGSTGDVLQLTINEDGQDRIYTYFLSTANAQLNVENYLGINAFNSLNTRISDLTFTRLGNLGGRDNIRMIFTLSSTTKTQSGYEVQHYQTTLGLR